MVKVQCILDYNDLQLKRLVKAGEELEVTKDRAEVLVNKELVKVVGVIPEPEKEPEVEEASEPVEEKKVEKKPTTKKARKNK